MYHFHVDEKEHEDFHKFVKEVRELTERNSNLLYTDEIIGYVNLAVVLDVFNNKQNGNSYMILGEL